MGIIIRDMELPKSCYDCPCHNKAIIEEWSYCNLLQQFTNGVCGRLADCPLKKSEPVVHAHWELIGQAYGHYEHKCSRCHRSVFTYSSVKIENIDAVYPYCHCGAKMDGEEKRGNRYD